MVRLHHEPHYTFRFAEPRTVPRFHLDGMEPGRGVRIHRWTPDGPGELIAEAVVGEDGWVDLREPLLVSPEQGFLVVPNSAR